MDILFIALALAVVMVMIWWSRAMNERAAMKKRIADIKARELKRRLNLGSSNLDPYSASMDIGLSLHVTEMDDKFDGHYDLTGIQKETINKIMTGYKPEIIHRDIFNAENIEEVIVLDDSWIKNFSDK